MAKKAKAVQTPKPPPGFVASAVRLPPVSVKQVGTSEGWQSDAWRCFDNIAELRYIASWLGNVMSRARLYAAQRNGQSLDIHEDGPAAEAMDAFFDGFQGQAAMLQDVTVNLVVAGEAYVIARGSEPIWDVLGTGRVSANGRRVSADWGDGKQELASSDLSIRIWNPHPLSPYRADSPTRPNLRTLQEIELLNEHIQAQLTSRLAGAGILFLPNSITVPNGPGTDPAASQADQLMQVLAEAMTTPIKDRSNPAAIVPILVTVDGEDLQKIQKMDFWTSLDKAVIEMRDNAVKRFAIGMDTPPEILLGMADTSHWNAWQIDEASIKSHIEPRLAQITQAITSAYLRPALQGVVDDPDDWYCVADTSEIRLRPNRSQEAMEAYDRGEISGDALRRETGFKPEDAPSLEEARQWMLRKIAMGSTSPEQTAAALRILGAPLDAGLDSATENKPIPPGLQPRRSLEDKPTVGRPPSMDDAEERAQYPSRQSAALTQACEFLVFRALERAGNRLCSGKDRSFPLRAVPAHRRYLEASGRADFLLEGTWEFAQDMLADYTDDVDEVIGVLDFYVRGLLTTRRPYSRATLGTLLDREVVGGGYRTGAEPVGTGGEPAHGPHPG